MQVVFWGRGTGRAGGGELDQFQGGQLPAGVADEQVQVAQAQAVGYPGDGVREADEPEVVLAVQGEDVAGLAGWPGWSRTASSLVMPQSAAMARASASAAAAAAWSPCCRSSGACSCRVCASMGRAPSRRWQPAAAR